MSRIVEKLRVPVRLSLIGCAPVEGCLFLGPRAELHGGPESLADRLNARTRVVPFQRSEADPIVLVVRSHIQWVLAGHEVAPQLVRAAYFKHTSEERVRVRLLGGASFEGMLAFEMPHEFNRVSDFLNRDEDFFALQAEQGMLLIHKDCVLDVVLQDSGADRRAA